MRELAVRPDQPHLIAPRLDPGVPVFSLGRYAGARREAIVAVKEHGRADLIKPLAAALHVGLMNLLTWGVVDTPLRVVPAPTRRSAARRRGGDPVTRMALAATAGHPDITVTQALRMRAFVRDSVGLSGTDRERNIAGRVKAAKPVAGDVLVIDDIVTTGATASGVHPGAADDRRARRRCSRGRTRLTRSRDGSGNYFGDQSHMKN